MKKIIIKIDRFILDQLTTYIKIWIKKHDFKKHKTDFSIQVKYVDFYLLILLCIILQPIYSIFIGNMSAAVAGALMWGLIGGLLYVFIRISIMTEKPSHDILFSMRKNPNYYTAYKEAMEILFIKERRQRIIMISLVIFLTILVASTAFLTGASAHTFFTFIYIIISNFLIGTVIRYTRYVFDFDPPEEKKKVVKESLTELMARVWQDLVGGFAPAPNFGT